MRSNALNICNRALTLVKHQHLSSLQPGFSQEGDLCITLLENVKTEVLLANFWKISITNIQITCRLLKDGYLVQSFKYVFILPDDCLRVLLVDDCQDYLRQGNKLYTNASLVNITYVANTDVENLDYQLSYLVALKLAVELANYFSLNESMMQYLLGLYANEFKRAANLDSKEGVHIISDTAFSQVSWIDRR